MKAASKCSLLRVSCGMIRRSSVGVRGWEEHFVMWQCLRRSCRKPYAKIQYLSLAMQALPLHVSRWCRANFGPASSFSCSVFRFDSKSFSSLFFWCFHCKVCSALCGSLFQAASDSTWQIAKFDFLSWDINLFQVQKRFRVCSWGDAQPAWTIQNWHSCSPEKMQRVLRLLRVKTQEIRPKRCASLGFLGFSLASICSEQHEPPHGVENPEADPHSWRVESGTGRAFGLKQSSYRPEGQHLMLEGLKGFIAPGRIWRLACCWLAVGLQEHRAYGSSARFEQGIACRPGFWSQILHSHDL